MVLVVNPTRPDYAQSAASTEQISASPTRKLLLNVLEKLVAVAVNSNQGTGFGITWNRNCVSLVPWSDGKPLTNVLFAENRASRQYPSRLSLASSSPSIREHTCIWWPYSCEGVQLAASS